MKVASHDLLMDAVLMGGNVMVSSHCLVISIHLQYNQNFASKLRQHTCVDNRATHRRNFRTLALIIAVLASKMTSMAPSPELINGVPKTQTLTAVLRLTTTITALRLIATATPSRKKTLHLPEVSLLTVMAAIIQHVTRTRSVRAPPM